MLVTSYPRGVDHRVWGLTQNFGVSCQLCVLYNT